MKSEKNTTVGGKMGRIPLQNFHTRCVQARDLRGTEDKRFITCFLGNLRTELVLIAEPSLS
jgi:hypothetical protein